MTVSSWSQNLLTTPYDRSRSHARYAHVRRKAERVLARGPRRLSAAARADRDAARLLLRAAAGAIGLDTPDLDARGRRQSRHHRTVCAGRHALHVEVPVGAAGRCAASAVLHAAIRPTPRLVVVVATAPDRRDPLACHGRPRTLGAIRGC